MDSVERYWSLKARGKCVYCGKRDAIEGQTGCEVCREKRVGRNREQARRRYRARLAAGVCVSCGGPRSPDGYVTCAMCRRFDKIRHEGRNGKVSGT